MKRFAQWLWRGIVFLFMRIEEPRVIRLFQFAIYVVLGTLGIAFLMNPTPAFEGVLGTVLAINFGAAISMGGLIGAVAVLPGVWWAERLAIISLISGLLMYLIVAVSLDASSVGIGISIALILSLSLRWLHVRRYQFAPGK